MAMALYGANGANFSWNSLAAVARLLWLAKTLING
jgi:hypothetical protein